MRALIVFFVRCYRCLLSPLLAPRCRYLPTCSEYAIEAVSRHGTLKGGGLALRRLCRCHPMAGFGFDPVPEKIVEHRHG